MGASLITDDVSRNWESVNQKILKLKKTEFEQMSKPMKLTADENDEPEHQRLELREVL